jgi:4-carboxymuconolactone decarboxylase
MRLPDADPAASPALAAALAGFQASRGIVSNVMRSFAHAPEGLAAIAELGAYCRYRTDLTELQRELVILTTGRGVAYAWHHHAPIARRVGMTDAQLDALRRGEVPQGLDAAGAAIVEYVLAYAALRGVPQPVFDRLGALLTPRQVTDVNIIAGYYLCIAASIIGLEVATDPPEVLATGAQFGKAG